MKKQQLPQKKHRLSFRKIIMIKNTQSLENFNIRDNFDNIAPSGAILSDCINLDEAWKLILTRIDKKAKMFRTSKTSCFINFSISTKHVRSRLCKRKISLPFKNIFLESSPNPDEFDYQFPLQTMIYLEPKNYHLYIPHKMKSMIEHSHFFPQYSQMALNNIKSEYIVYSYITYTDLLQAYTFLIDHNAMKEIFAISPRFIQRFLSSQSKIYSNFHLPEDNFPLFDPIDNYLYLSFENIDYQEPIRIKNPSAMFNLSDICDIQISHITQSTDPFSHIFQHPKTFIGFDNPFRLYQSYQYLLAEGSKVNTKLETELYDKYSQIKFHNSLFYIEIYQKAKGQIPKPFFYSINYEDLYDCGMDELGRSIIVVSFRDKTELDKTIYELMNILNIMYNIEELYTSNNDQFRSQNPSYKYHLLLKIDVNSRCKIDISDILESLFSEKEEIMAIKDNYYIVFFEREEDYLKSYKKLKRHQRIKSWLRNTNLIQNAIQIPAVNEELHMNTKDIFNDLQPSVEMVENQQTKEESTTNNQNIEEIAKRNQSPKEIVVCLETSEKDENDQKSNSDQNLEQTTKLIETIPENTAHVSNPVFKPNPRWIYIQFQESLNSQARNNYILIRPFKFGVSNIMELHRNYYLPNDNCKYSFMGFSTLEDVKEAYNTISFRSSVKASSIKLYNDDFDITEWDNLPENHKWRASRKHNIPHVEIVLAEKSNKLVIIPRKSHEGDPNDSQQPISGQTATNNQQNSIKTQMINNSKESSKESTKIANTAFSIIRGNDSSSSNPDNLEEDKCDVKLRDKNKAKLITITTARGDPKNAMPTKLATENKPITNQSQESNEQFDIKLAGKESITIETKLNKSTTMNLRLKNLSNLKHKIAKKKPKSKIKLPPKPVIIQQPTVNWNDRPNEVIFPIISSTPTNNKPKSIPENNQSFDIKLARPTWLTIDTKFSD